MPTSKIAKNCQMGAKNGKKLQNKKKFAWTKKSIFRLLHKISSEQLRKLEKSNHLVTIKASAGVCTQNQVGGYMKKLEVVHSKQVSKLFLPKGFKCQPSVNFH